MKAVFDAYDELCHLWGYAEDLETFEHANKLLLSYCASPVSLVTSHLKNLADRLQTSHPDTQDDVRILAGLAE